MTSSFLKGAMRHILTIPRAGARPLGDLYKNRAPKFGPTITSATELLDFLKSASRNSEHLANAAKHLDSLGAHLRTAKSAHPEDENLGSAVQHHRMATSFLRKIDLDSEDDSSRFGPEGQDAIPNLPNPSGKPAPANANERGHDTYPDPVGRGGEGTLSHAAGSRPDAGAFMKSYRIARRDGRRVMSFR